MKDEYIFSIDNSIIQYHHSTNSFRIGLKTFDTMCVTIDNTINDYSSPNYYVLKKIPQQKTNFNIKLIKCNINELRSGDLIYTKKFENDLALNDMNIRENFALVLNTCNKDNSCELVRVYGNDICYTQIATPEKIYKVIYDESNC